MKSIEKISVWSILSLFILAISCQQDPFVNTHNHDDHEHHDHDHVDLNVTGFPPITEPSDNPTTQAGIDLGRHLFYDNAVGCFNCHFQNNSFSAPINREVEIQGNVHMRSPMPLINLVWVNDYSWAGRDNQGLETKITSAVEVSSQKVYSEVLEDLNNSSFDYPPMYYAAFEDSTINQTNTNKALAQFLRSIIASDTRVHQFLNGDSSALSELEVQGFNLFKSEEGNCFHCHLHTNYLFTDNSIRNNGLEEVSSVYDFPDPGHYYASGIDFDRGKFRSVTLINIEHTAPYMHDGRFATLEEVVDHYNSGGHFSPNLDNIMNETSDGLNLTQQEKDALIAFMKALTDSTVLTAEKFGSPF